VRTSKHDFATQLECDWSRNEEGGGPPPPSSFLLQIGGKRGPRKHEASRELLIQTIVSCRVISICFDAQVASYIVCGDWPTVGGQQGPTGVGPKKGWSER